MSLKSRASAILERKMRCFPHRFFKQREKHDRILGDMPDLAAFETRRADLWAEHGHLPVELRQMYIEPLLSREQEYHLFRKYNFYKWQVIQRRALFEMDALDERVIGLCEECLKLAKAVSQQIVASNVRLVVNLVKKHKWYLARPGPQRLVEMTSEGQMGLYAAIDYFDYNKGNKFSTYATYAVRDWLTKGVTYEAKQEERFLVGMDELLNITPTREEEDKPEPSVYVRRLLQTLTDARTKTVVERYYGIRDGHEQTLEVIAVDLGLSKERVRQIRDHGLKIIREALETHDALAP